MTEGLNPCLPFVLLLVALYKKGKNTFYLVWPYLSCLNGRFKDAAA